MALAMRLSRGGRKARPFYRIVVADSRMPRDGRYIERLGTYNPLLNDDNDQRVQLNEERIKYWLGEGAKPSKRVSIFLGKAGIIDMPTFNETPKKSAPSEKTLQMKADKEEKRKAAEEAAKQAEEDAKAAEEAAKAEAEAAPAEEAAEAPAEDAKSEEKTEEAPAEEAKPEEKAEEKPEEPKAEAAEEEKKDA